MDGKSEKDKIVQGRMDDSNEMKFERVSYTDFMAEAKPGKESYGSGNGLLNRIENQKGKTYSDGLGGFGDVDRVHQRAHLLGAVDMRKEYSTSTNYKKEHIGSNKDAGNNKIVLKGDDKDKEKDRKRKEIKHHDLGEREKSADRDITQFVAGGNNNTEMARDDGEGDKRDVSKEKDGPKDSLKDNIHREARNAVDKEVTHSEKWIADDSTIHDKAALDQKKPKVVDGYRIAGKEVGERRKEREEYGQGERPEKRTRCSDKQPDTDGVHVTADKEKDIITCDVQQQKGIPKKNSPQVANLEARFRHCALESDRLKGKPEVTTIVYKAGECMLELIKLWKEYESYWTDKKEESSFGSPTLEVKIPGQHVTATNRQVKRKQLWGTDVYTDDSDIVAVLMHMGYCRTSINSADPDLQDLRVIIRVLPPQDHYVSTSRNNVRSRPWGLGIGCSYRVEQCFLVKKGCEPREIQRSLTDSSASEPTFAPISVGRTMTTRAAASNASRKQRMVKEVVILYSLSNEPWIKYSINIVADKGLKKSTFTSARLKKGEALYMETNRHRYELSFIREKVVKAGLTHEHEAGKSQGHHPDAAANHSRSAADAEIVDIFRFSQCKKILPQTNMLKHGVPLPVDMLEVLEDNLDWEDVLWSQNGVWIGGKEYKIARVQFITPTLNVASLV